MKEWTFGRCKRACCFFLMQHNSRVRVKTRSRHDRYKWCSTMQHVGTQACTPSRRRGKRKQPQTDTQKKKKMEAQTQRLTWAWFAFWNGTAVSKSVREMLHLSQLGDRSQRKMSNILSTNKKNSPFSLPFMCYIFLTLDSCQRWS